MDFSRSGNFSKTVLSLIAGLKAQTEELERIQQIFIDLDKDADGKLTKEELKKGFQNSLELSAGGEDFAILLDAMDLDKDGLIDYQEFMQATINRQLLMNEKNLTEAFNILDLNKDGNISREELEEVFSGSSRDELKRQVDEVLAECDSDKNGQISRTEFAKAMELVVRNSIK